jgi:hypothetical protein
MALAGMTGAVPPPGWRAVLTDASRVRASWAAFNQG